MDPAQTNTEFDVAIVGGGMVGLSLALALGGSDLRVAVIDREAPEHQLAERFDGRVSAIAAGSQRILQGIGAWDGMAAAAEPILDIRVSDGASPLFLHYDSREIGEGPLGYIVENRRIRHVLHGRVAQSPNIRLFAPAQFERAERGPGTASLTLTDGTTIFAALLISAEGRTSRLRREAGIRVSEWTYRQIGLVCTALHERPHRGVAHERFLPAGPFAILPMRDDETGAHRSSIVWTERAELAPRLLSLPDPEFDVELARRFGDFLGRIRSAGQRWSYPLSLMHAERYVDERLALVGDAAHVIHPIAGQGLNLGIRDAAALAEVLVDAYRLGLDVGSTVVLARYQRWRRPDNVTLALVTDGLNRLFSNNFGPLRLARDIGLGLVHRAPPLKRLFMRHAMGLVGELPRLARGEPL